jgi:hypothetical protein
MDGKRKTVILYPTDRVPGDKKEDDTKVHYTPPANLYP